MRTTFASLARRAALSWGLHGRISPQRLWPILRSRGGLEGLLAMDAVELSEALGSSQRARAVLSAGEDRTAEKTAESWSRMGIEVVTAFEEGYPPDLLETADPPFALFYVGDLARLKAPRVAIVGSRAASLYGRQVAARLARELSSVGIAVVSGFARGIDTEAHEAAREGAGGTIAILGCGIDVDYPRENAALRRALPPKNLVLAEFPPGTEPRPQNFPVRNRIIAGISAGVVVVEASRRSGSLITARLAADAGRDVFAVPGSVFSENSAGSHELLRDGAILCRGSEDVLAELFPSVGAPARSEAAAIPADLTGEARRLLEVLLVEESASAEELALATDLPAAVVLAALLELEGAGLAVLADGGRYGLRR